MHNSNKHINKGEQDKSSYYSCAVSNNIGTCTKIKPKRRSQDSLGFNLSEAINGRRSCSPLACKTLQHIEAPLGLTKFS